VYAGKTLHDHEPFGVLSVSAITSLAVMGTTRIAYALARGGLLPASLATVAPNGTPRNALAAIVLLIALFVGTGTYNTLSSTATSLYEVIVVVVLSAAIGLRLREPGMERPYRMPLYPLPVIVALAANAALMAAFIYDDPFDALFGVVIVIFLTLGWLAMTRLRRRESIA